MESFSKGGGHDRVGAQRVQSVGNRTRGNCVESRDVARSWVPAPPESGASWPRGTCWTSLSSSGGRINGMGTEWTSGCWCDHGDTGWCEKACGPRPGLLWLAAAQLQVPHSEPPLLGARYCCREVCREQREPGALGAREQQETKGAVFLARASVFRGHLQPVWH